MARTKLLVIEEVLTKLLALVSSYYFYLFAVGDLSKWLGVALGLCLVLPLYISVLISPANASERRIGTSLGISIIFIPSLNILVVLTSWGFPAIGTDPALSYLLVQVGLLLASVLLWAASARLLSAQKLLRFAGKSALYTLSAIIAFLIIAKAFNA